MPCYHPLFARRGAVNPLTGNRAIVFGIDEHYKEPLLGNRLMLPCGRCVGCRLERSRQWAARMMHEASLSRENSFITLTYDDAHMPEGATLVPRDFQLFMKRLRKSIYPKRVRFFHAGEYGDVFGRPHYHACLFGYDFDDKFLHTVRNGFPVWRSSSLEKLWEDGFSEIGSLTFESAAYVARYCTKKVTGPKAEAHYGGRHPEYATMSRGGRKTGPGGIGMDWMNLYPTEVYPADSIVVRGHLSKPPRAYDKRFQAVNPEGFDDVAAVRRIRSLERDSRDGRPLLERLDVEEKCAIARQSTLERRSL